MPRWWPFPRPKPARPPKVAIADLDLRDVVPQLPSGVNAPVAPVPPPDTYITVEGDTALSVATKTGVHINRIGRYNGITYETPLEPGTTLKLTDEN